MESVLRKAGVHRNGTNCYKSVQLIAYTDDINIIGRTMRDVTAAFSAIERESANIGLAVNVDVVKEFIYLGTAINTNNDVSLEIKRRITLANRCYFGLNKQWSSRDLCRAT